LATGSIERPDDVPPLETSTEWHYPFTEYMGPGTHVISKVLNAVLPRNYLDAVSLTHDINYLLATANPKLLNQADNVAIGKAMFAFPSLQRTTFVAGLLTRKVLQLKTDEHAGQFLQYTRWGNTLKSIVLNSDKFKSIREAYGIDDTYFI